jgi:hypothetical protein
VETSDTGDLEQLQSTITANSTRKEEGKGKKQKKTYEVVDGYEQN